MAGLFSDNLPQTTPNTSFFQNAPTPQMPQNVLPQNPLPITDAQRIPLLQDIILAKQGYETVNKGLLDLNQQLENPDLSDEDKQKIQGDIALGNKALEGFSNYAASVRNTANAIGLDISDYGSDKTLGESTQALNNYAASAVRDLFAMPSVAEQEQARFEELVLRGVRPSQAHRLVKFDHPKVQGEYERRLRDGIMTYGKNPDGSLNDVGISLMHSALSSSPQTATLFGTAFALPKSVFDANNTRNLAILGNEAAMAREMERIIAAAKQAELERQAKEKNLLATLDNREKIENIRQDRTDARTEFVEGKKDNRTQAEIESRERTTNANLIANSPAGKFASHYQVGLGIYGGDEVKAMDYAMRQTSKWNPDDKKASAAQGVFNLYDTMFSHIAQGNEDAAGTLLERLTAKEDESLDEFSANFTPEENQKLNDLRSAFAEYLSFGNNPDDPKDAKARAHALRILQAKYLAVKRGTKWQDEFTAITQASGLTRRNNGKENKPNEYDDNDAMNKRVRALLGNDDKPKSTYTPPPVGGSGHFGTWTPNPNIPYITR